MMYNGHFLAPRPSHNAIAHWVFWSPTRPKGRGASLTAHLMSGGEDSEGEAENIFFTSSEELFAIGCLKKLT